MKYIVFGMKRDEEYPLLCELETIVEITKGVHHSDLLAVIDWTQSRPNVEWIIISWEEEKE